MVFRAYVQLSDHASSNKFKKKMHRGEKTTSQQTCISAESDTVIKKKLKRTSLTRNPDLI